MSNTETAIEKSVTQLPESALERKYIDHFLDSKGYTLAEARKLPAEEYSLLMRMACTYAALKLAEVVARSRFRNTIRAPSA